MTIVKIKKKWSMTTKMWFICYACHAYIIINILVFNKTTNNLKYAKIHIEWSLRLYNKRKLI